MSITVRALSAQTLPESLRIWNHVVEEGAAFPQTEVLSPADGAALFAQQSYTAAAQEEDSGEVLGMYILHPNNVGRCGHICNASYAVKSDKRGLHIGETLVRDCMKQAKALGFRILQFNAVVRSNTAALKLYQRLGFTQLGVIPQGFRNKDGIYEDIIPHYILL